MPDRIAQQNALISIMVLAAVADSDIDDDELGKMTRIVQSLPVFQEYDISAIPDVAREVVALLQDPDGIAKALTQVHETLPQRLYETAYALAVDVVAADAVATQEELRLLEMLRHELNVGRLEAAAIERGARARHTLIEAI